MDKEIFIIATYIAIDSKYVKCYHVDVMKTLPVLAKENPSWGLEDFVGVLNRYLPDYIYPDSSDARLNPRVNQRLVRYYTTQGMLDEPLKSGRNAVYTYRHLLQTLTVRRLLSEGYASGIIGKLAREKSNRELEELLQGGFNVDLSVANPALNYLNEIKQREKSKGGQSRTGRETGGREEQTNTTDWTRVEIMPGLEINIRSDLAKPRSEHEKQSFLRLIISELGKYLG